MGEQETSTVESPHRFRQLLEAFYRSREKQMFAARGKLALLDTNEHLGVKEGEERGYDYSTTWMETDFSKWLSKQTEIRGRTVDGGILGIGAGNIFSMLEIFKLLSPQKPPEFLIGIDINPSVIAAGETVVYLAKQVGGGKMTKEEAVKLIYGCDKWDEESKKVLGIKKVDTKRYSLARMMDLIKGAVGESSPVLLEAVERSWEEVEDMFKYLRSVREGVETRSLVSLVDITHNQFYPSLTLSHVLFENFSEIVELAMADRIHFVLGSIKDREVLGLIKSAYPNLSQKANIFYESNALNHIEMGIEAGLSSSSREERKEMERKILNFQELGETFDPTNKGIHVYTNNTGMTKKNGIDVYPYELIASDVPPSGSRFGEY